LVIAFQRSTDRSAIDKLDGGDKVKVITLDAGDDASVRVSDAIRWTANAFGMSLKSGI
jgi:hypothetical protein